MNRKTYLELLEDTIGSGEQLTYLDKLSTVEWHEKRQQIIKRDNSLCHICKEPLIKQNVGTFRKKTQSEADIYIKEMQLLALNSDTLRNKYSIDNLPAFLKNIYVPLTQVVLHVHHTYYVDGKLPWEYPNEALLTLCSFCHQEFHNLNDVPVYCDETKLSELKVTKCPSCNGSGYRPEYHYYMNGVCFGCNGYKYLEFK